MQIVCGCFVAVAPVQANCGVRIKNIPAMMRGCTPSLMYRSAYFSSSPVKRTEDVVPSPVTSSCAVAVRAIIIAVGCWICISCSSTFPSFVSFTCPVPSTNIFNVPRGPASTVMLNERCVCENVGAQRVHCWSRRFPDDIVRIGVHTQIALHDFGKSAGCSDVDC